jgi:hypothetical protein
MRMTLAAATMLSVGALLGWLAASVLTVDAFAQDGKTTEATPKAPANFNGVVKLDVRDYKPDWTPFTPKTAPKGAPNVLVVLYDDTGLAAWSPYGGRINMPTMDRPAKTA